MTEKKHMPIWIHAATMLANDGPVEAVDISGLMTAMLKERCQLVKCAEETVNLCGFVEDVSSAFQGKSNHPVVVLARKLKKAAVLLSEGDRS